MASKILQICAPSTPMWGRVREKLDDGNWSEPTLYLRVSLWALVRDDDDDEPRVVGIEMVDMSYIIDDEAGFFDYTDEAPK